MEKMPKAIFIVDTNKEDTAVKEAMRLEIPIVGLIDTNCNPDYVDYPIPGNDDAAKSIKLVTTFIAECVIEGRKRFLSYLSESGVAVKQESDMPVDQNLLPEEEIKIKEIEEIVETSTPEKVGEARPIKKARVGKGAEEHPKKNS